MAIFPFYFFVLFILLLWICFRIGFFLLSLCWFKLVLLDVGVLLYSFCCWCWVALFGLMLIVVCCIGCGFGFDVGFDLLFIDLFVSCLYC